MVVISEIVLKRCDLRELPAGAVVVNQEGILTICLPHAIGAANVEQAESGGRGNLVRKCPVAGRHCGQDFPGTAVF